MDFFIRKSCTEKGKRFSVVPRIFLFLAYEGALPEVQRFSIIKKRQEMLAMGGMYDAGAQIVIPS